LSNATTGFTAESLGGREAPLEAADERACDRTIRIEKRVEDPDVKTGDLALCDVQAR
jgi:hypothetical protein